LFNVAKPSASQGSHVRKSALREARERRQGLEPASGMPRGALQAGERRNPGVSGLRADSIDTRGPDFDAIAGSEAHVWISWIDDVVVGRLKPSEALPASPTCTPEPAKQTHVRRFPRWPPRTRARPRRSYPAAAVKVSPCTDIAPAEVPRRGDAGWQRRDVFTQSGQNVRLVRRSGRAAYRDYDA
jgi:hypothetical protein